MSSRYDRDCFGRDDYTRHVKARDALRRREARTHAVTLAVVAAIAVVILALVVNESMTILSKRDSVTVESVIPNVRADVEMTYSEENEKFLLRLRTPGDLPLTATFVDKSGLNVVATWSSQPGDYSPAAPAAYVDLDTLKRVDAVRVTSRDGDNVNAVGLVGDADVRAARERVIRDWMQVQGRLAVEQGFD